MILKILKYPDPKLKKRTKPVSKISKEIFQLTDNMIETMLKHEGIGLAANQVGSELRIFVINAALGKQTPEPMICINPEIISQEGLLLEEEGCLSFPELYIKIARPESVLVHAKNLYNEDIMLEAIGYLARAVMHELDHLNGIAFIDHVEKVDEEKVKEYLEKLSENKKTS